MLLFAAGMMALLAGCTKNTNDHTGTLKVLVTDAPFPIEYIDEATVTITKVEVRMVSDSSDAVFKTVMEDTVTVNLLDLRNGITDDLAEAELEPGTYDLVRIYVSDASLSIIGGETFDLKVPGGEQTGIKVFISPAVEITGGLTSELLLDFNLDKSFILKGNWLTPAGIKGFSFKPVIRAVNTSTAGTIAGTVSSSLTSDPLAGASVWVARDTTLASTQSDSAGYYALPGIPAGSWSVFATAENYDTVHYENVSVTAGNRLTLDFELTPKE